MPFYWKTHIFTQFILLDIAMRYKKNPYFLSNHSNYFNLFKEKVTGFIIKKCVEGLDTFS